ncbi:putative glucarate transporter [Labilithrix luteola]|uniref:Putative glucarate transporter n=1 Tax=Labilithrix luteola TaxID=1391654 RepID=A0A0K1QEQ7_9BACT|nr:MFS transporter [Labilithrix luteola]AKV04157.1 putative glucarate transporter [Labilithrix luteola]
MLRRIPDRNIWTVYSAILLLGIAYGTSLAVLSIHLDALGIAKVAMGWLAFAFGLGIVSFSVPAGILSKKLGPKPILVAALLGYTLCVATFPFLGTLATLAIARFFDGVFSVNVWVSAETALLSRSQKDQKGFVMSLYAISIALGYVVGPILSRILVPLGTTSAFLAAGALATVAALVVLFKLDGSSKADGESAHALTSESAEKRAANSAATIFWKVKTACAATFSYGYFQASVVLFLPLYLIEAKGIAKNQTILIPAFFAGGMLLTSTVAGLIGDRFGHLFVMRILGIIGGTMVASFVLLSAFPAMCVAVFVAGATLASISPLSLALQGVVTPEADLGLANSFYNAFYATGMLLGPPISGFLFMRWGGGTMLLHLAGMWALFVVLTVIFASDDPRYAARRARPSEDRDAEPMLR